MGRRDAGEAPARHRDAVVAAQPRDDLLLPVAAARIVVVPDELHRGVIGLGARVVEEHLGHGDGHELDEALGQVDGGIVGLRGELVIEGQLPHLAARRLHEPLLAEAEGGAPEPGEGLDVLAPRLVLHVDAAPAGDHERPLGLVLAQVGEGMELIGDVAGRRGSWARRHGSRSSRGSVSGGVGASRRRLYALPAPIPGSGAPAPRGC